MANLSYKTLQNGVKIPALAFGSGTALYTRDAKAQVLQALHAGIRHIDTAQVYGNEASVGDGIAAFLNETSTPRSSLFVTTKFWNGSSGQTVSDVLKGELRDLKLDYVDLYLWHTPEKYVGRIGEVWKQFEAVKEQGLAKEIGISNFRVGDLKELLASIEENGGIVPAVHQIELHPYVHKYALPILDIHRQYNIQLAAYGGQIPVTKKTNGPVTPVIQAIAEKLSAETKREVNTNHVLLKWLDAKDAIVITTSSKKERLLSFLEASELPALSEEDVTAIDDAGSKLHFRGYNLY
ncbi:hypothetical protein FRC17_003073 [Serendipita sp. 399]|nr:hypothetical protein FRC17_003073 [Serendipita sp. 399]